jgi:serine protease
MRVLLLLAAFSWSATLSSAQPLASELDRPLYEEGVVAIKLRDASLAARPAPEAAITGVASLDAALSSIQTLSIERAFQLHPMASRGGAVPDLARIYHVRFASREDVRAVARRLAEDPEIEYAEPVPLNYPDGIPADALYGFLQHLPQIMAEEAWAIHRGQDGAEDVIVAITDAGVEWYHPDLAPNIWHNLGEDANDNGRTLLESGDTWVFDPGDLNGVDDDGNGYVDDLIGWNFSTSQSNDPNTGHDHGTHVAGIAGAVTDNGIGVASISHNVKLMPVSSYDSGCNCLPNAYQLLIYAAENGAHIINASWGSIVYARVNEEVINYVRSLGSIVVSSAGNRHSLELGYPSSYPGVVSVGAVAVTDGKATYSSFGPAVTVSAPGGQSSMFADGGILSTGNYGSYIRYQGTSMASPMVAGLLALLKSYRPDWSNEQLIRQVVGTADDISAVNPQYAGLLGSGRINAFRALTETDVTLPQLLRLHLVESGFREEVDDGFYTVGEAIHLDVRLGNFARLVDADEVVLTLESGDPFVEILSGPYSAPLAHDGHITTSFELRILPGATTGTVPLHLRATADLPIASGDVFEFEFPVANGGVLVWDGRSDEGFYSGRFIYDFLRQQGVPALYVGNPPTPDSSSFPATLSPFDAVFLSFGAGIHMMTTMFTAEQNRIEAYLRAGGHVYIEGSRALGDGAFQSSASLMSVLGIGAIDPGPFEKSAPALLVGQAGSILEGITFPGYGQEPIRLVNRYTPNAFGVVALEEPDFGVVAIQGSGEHGQRSFVSSYALVNTRDGQFPAQRRNLLMRVIEHFGIEAPPEYAHLDFSADVRSGHAPLTVTFTDLSSVSMPGILLEWDLDGDGNVNATGATPTWTYDGPGVYPVRLRLSSDGMHRDLAREAYVRVFDGTSALSFGDWEGKVRIAASGVSRLNLNAFTVEAWIRPSGWGTNPIGFGRIVDKEHVVLFLDRGGPLVLFLNHPDGTSSRLSTDTGTITLDEWQHVAATHAGGEISLYVNGVALEMNQAAAMRPDVQLNTWSDLYIGNNAASERAFQGEIDEVRLWNRVRTAAELLADMHAPLGGSEPGLIGYWPFDEGAGTVAGDVTPFNLHGTLQQVEWREGFASQPVSVEDGAGSLTSTTLLPNYPNPFRSTTSISYLLDRDQRVTLEVFNMLGQRVAVIVDEQQQSGQHALTFDARGMSSGVYILRLRTDSTALTRKMVILK